MVYMYGRQDISSPAIQTATFSTVAFSTVHTFNRLPFRPLQNQALQLSTNQVIKVTKCS